MIGIISSKLLLMSRSVAARFRPVGPYGYCSSTTYTNYEMEKEPESFKDAFTNQFPATRKLSRLLKRGITNPNEPSTVYTTPRWQEASHCLYVFVPVPGLELEDVKVSVDNNTVVVEGKGDETFEAMREFKKYICYFDLPDIDLPDKIYTTRGIKADMRYNSGEVTLTIPKVKQEEKTFDLKVNRTYKYEPSS